MSKNVSSVSLRNYSEPKPYFIKRIIWHFVNATLFRLFPSSFMKGWRNMLLRLFGAKIDKILLRKKYIETYIFVINLFMQDCPLAFGEKVREVKSLLNNNEFICSKSIVDIQENKLNMKIFNFFVKMQSPLLMSIGYTILFRVKGSYDLLKKKLRSKNRS